MAAESNEDDARTAARDEARRQQAASNGKDSVEQESEDEDGDDDEEGEDEEPKLKYTRLTSSLGPVYRNGDATSTFMVASDKMVRPTVEAPLRRNTHAEL
jgi:hypothetical protein